MIKSPVEIETHPGLSLADRPPRLPAYILEDVPADWFADTDPRTLEVYIQLHRDMDPGRRIARVFELCDLQQSLQAANVRADYPQADEREVFLRVAARRLRRKTMLEAYGWDPDLSR